MTIINRRTGEVLYGTILDFEDTDIEIGVTEILLDDFKKPYFNFVTREFYEGEI